MITEGPGAADWVFAVAFTFGGLFGGWLGYARWDGLGQAFLGALGAFALGSMVQWKWSQP